MIFSKQIIETYKRQLFSRCDDRGVAYYFDVSDFPGMCREPFQFVAEDGHKLNGYFYHYGNKTTDRIIIFEHGMGGGHRSYMNEIVTLAKAGYTVFAYDHTGCMESEGEGTRGFAQSLHDLDLCIKALKNSEVCKGCTFSVVGHSWGGYSTLNIGAYHSDITHRVAISGFPSVSDMLCQLFKGPLKLYKKDILSLERSTNPGYVDADATKSLKETEGKVLVIHSEDDKMVSIRLFDAMKEMLKGNSNVQFLRIGGKGHNPNYTEDAVKYKDAYLSEIRKRSKKKLLLTDESKSEFIKEFDWVRMTKQDEKLWKTIFDFLNS